MSPAVADDVSDEPLIPLEVGAYGGTFISNFYHQFYDDTLFPGGPGQPTREELQHVSPMWGLRVAYFFMPWLGAEAELNMILTETKMSHGKAQIYGGRVQVMLQYPTKLVVPYIAFGDGFDHISSEPTVLGTDTDFPIHIGAGVRFLVHRSITLRLDGRLLRAPSAQPPYTLNASLGEFMLGLSFRPSQGPSESRPPPPPPPTDIDGDGVLDDTDKCPNEPEDVDLFDDGDGCPDADNDRDGLSDAVDKCPRDAEDKDGFQDDDGCPEKDNDSDSVVDAQDKCPLEAEDKDGFNDLDGCPEPDNDKDGYPDTADKCPNEAEVINGVDDEDGCPDRGNALVVVSSDRFELFEPIVFKKTAIDKKSFNMLGQIGAQLRAHPEIVKLRISVHVQPTKKAKVDQQLSEKRANAVRDWLVKYGIDTARLELKGMGGTSPLVPAKQKGSKAINERVDLIIVEKK